MFPLRRAWSGLFLGRISVVGHWFVLAVPATLVISKPVVHK